MIYKLYCLYIIVSVAVKKEKGILKYFLAKIDQALESYLWGDKYLCKVPDKIVEYYLLW